MDGQKSLKRKPDKGRKKIVSSNRLMTTESHMEQLILKAFHRGGFPQGLDAQKSAGV